MDGDEDDSKEEGAKFLVDPKFCLLDSLLTNFVHNQGESCPMSKVKVTGD